MNSNKIKEFRLSSWAISNRITVSVITFIIILGGLLSYTGMARENFPEIIVPQIYVATPYPGNSALDVEKLITKRLEKEINSITGVDKITSNSIQGYSSIVVEFNFDYTPAEALQKVKDKVDVAMADNDFPKDLQSEPSVTEMNFSERIPIMNINLSGEFSMDQLKEYAEYLEDEIEELSEISSVDIRGVQEKELEIAVDLYKMEASMISFTDIENAVKFENMSVTGGDILENGVRKTVRVTGEFTDPLGVKDLIVKQEKGNIVYLRDIAKISFKEQEKESFAREYMQPVVMLDVKKRGGQNLLKASTKIDKIITKAQKSVFPKSLVISKTNDQSNETRTMVSDLENSIILGIILVVTVLYFFLGFRNALFVGIAIPLSMFLSFTVLGFMGVTLNTMVLFSLVIALGMLVDNGIVVVENVYRLMDEGYPRIQAAKLGVGEVAMPIIASTAT
ncbi:MAG: efflux RND transporter permease subunit, partial [Flavobacteriaceae bacterium]|nr:efflux RND transporter permease subunit [Flavobacteriaceae bacterium]